MKTHNLIFSIFCLVILGGCQAPPAKTIELAILMDKTGSNDHNEIDISTSDISEIFKLKENPFNNGTVRVSTLEDTHLSKIHQVKLSAIPSISNYQKYVREAEINHFFVEIDSLLLNVQKTKSGKSASSLFIPIHKEIRRINTTKADKKYLCIYSDLLENSNTLFSAYSEKEFRELVENPAKFTNRLIEKAPLPEHLNGLKIYLIYNPVLETDSQFLAISQWYKKVLEKRGASVHISANLIL